MCSLCSFSVSLLIALRIPAIPFAGHLAGSLTMSIELKLSRSNRVYCLGVSPSRLPPQKLSTPILLSFSLLAAFHLASLYIPQELVEGKIITILTSPLSYQKIIISLTGTVNLQVRGGVTGVIESLYSVVKPICIVKKSIELATSAGKLGPGRTEIHFSFSLSSEEKSGYGMFYETFHGGNISIQYLISADVTRGYLHKPFSATLELIVELDKASLTKALVSPEVTSFSITQDTQKHQLLPELSSGKFQITGNISTHCSLSESISGELIVEASAVPIRSIDIILLRVESILTGERIISDTSVIQTTQIADGDVCRSMTLPIYVILPRLLVCPTVLSGPFSIEFQVSIVISFQSELSKLYPKFDLQTPRPWLASLMLPLRVFRTY